MNWLDVVVISILGLRTWSGYRCGLVRQVFELGGLVGGLVLAARYYYHLEGELARYLSLPAPALAVLAFILILFGMMIVARLLGQIFTRFLQLPGLGWLNAVSGALMGALVALVAISFLLSLLNILSIPPVEAALSSSVVAPYLKQVTPYLMEFLQGYIPWVGAGGSAPQAEPLPAAGRAL